MGKYWKNNIAIWSHCPLGSSLYSIFCILFSLFAFYGKLQFWPLSVTIRPFRWTSGSPPPPCLSLTPFFRSFLWFRSGRDWLGSERTAKEIIRSCKNLPKWLSGPKFTELPALSIIWGTLCNFITNYVILTFHLRPKVWNFAAANA